MKAYVITSGEYSDYGILHVTLDKEKAEKFCAIYNNGNRYYYDEATIEEYEIDDFLIDDNVKILHKYAFGYNHRKKGFVLKWHKVEIDKGQKNFVSDDMVAVYLTKEDNCKAEKIAQDMFAKYKSERSLPHKQEYIG